MTKMSKAECSRAGKALAKNSTSAAGRKLAQCRWGKKGAKATKPRAAPRAGVRQSRRIAGKGTATVRQPEPPKKPRKKAAKKKVGGQSSPGLKRIENILVPGLNAPKGSNKAWLAEQRRIWGA